MRDATGETPAGAKEAAELVELRRLHELDALLPAIAGILDLREAFEKVSEIAKKSLPHDVLVVILYDEAIEWAHVYATSGALPDVPDRFPISKDIAAAEGEDTIIADLANDPRIVASEAARKIGVQAGLRSMLRVSIHLEGRFAGSLHFNSRRPGFYTAVDLAVAKRVRDHVALALSHQRLAETRERLAAERERAVRAEERAKALTEELAAATGYGRVIGDSKPWKAVLAQAAKVAGTETTVLVTGESGTGKEVLARLIHARSKRASGPFVAINCAALPENLLESELFGFEKGAFSGAVQAKPGRIEQAAGGTLLLDEVGEMSLLVQAKLLRFLEQREFQRLGGTRTHTADVRVVAATNRDLKKASGRGEFREDLYYRVSVFEIRTPPLRERPGDILLLAEAFLAELSRTLGRIAGLSREARERLIAYRWPGNVRELRNVLERASILCEGGLITSEHLAIADGPAEAAPAQAESDEAPAKAKRGRADLAELERETIERVLEEVHFNKTRAAKRLGITRAKLYARLKRYGLLDEDDEEEAEDSADAAE